jgi:hypothetical protein
MFAVWEDPGLNFEYLTVTKERDQPSFMTKCWFIDNKSLSR